MQNNPDNIRKNNFSLLRTVNKWKIIRIQFPRAASFPTSVRDSLWRFMLNPKNGKRALSSNDV